MSQPQQAEAETLPPSRKGNLFGLSAEAIAGLGPLAGEPSFRARQIAHWVYGRGAEDLGTMTSVSRRLRDRLGEAWEIRRAHPVEESTVGDESATKLLFRLEDGCLAEAVWIRDPRRETLCISSQAGCAYGCAFCATATLKAGRNLLAGEILSQFVAMKERISRRSTGAAAAERDPSGTGDGPGKVHNIVFMGMGEPLANYAEVVAALRILCGHPGYGMAARRVTISTVGLEPEIRLLAREPLAVRLAFSLNATTDEVRSRLMPVNRKYPFRSIFEALREYQGMKKERVTLEYVLLKGVNDGKEDAARLARYARSLDCKVNLIAYNPHPYASFEPVSDRGIEEFRSAMLPTAPRVTTTVRWSKGREIQAACGQLAARG